MYYSENSQNFKVGFLFLNKPYMVYHSIGIAIELAKSPIIQVNLFCLKRNLPIIEHIMEKYQCQGHNICIDVLEPHWHSYLPTFIEYATLLRFSIFYKYRRLFRSFDAFVCTAYNDLNLKKRTTKKGNAKFIFTHHGVPNREYAYENTITGFNFFFLFGPKIKRIRESRNQLTPSNHVMTGYIKYDLVKQFPKKVFFGNKNITILYNPHFLKKFSSFYQFGKAILDFFSKHQQYNLIFAPHTSLYYQSWSKYKWTEYYKKYENILIDFGSRNSIDMSYTKYADMYIGDASSQALEFLLIKPRPMIFIDAHSLESNPIDRPLSWDYGDIVDDIENLSEVIIDSFSNYEKKYRIKQEKGLNDLFYKGEKSPSVLAAGAIVQLLRNKN